MGESKMSPEEKEILVASAKNLVSHLQELLKEKAFVTYGFGTLLGIAREGKVIETDDDIDLLIICKGDRAEVKQQMQDTYKTLYQEGVLTKVWYLGGAGPFKEGLRLTGQAHVETPLQGKNLDIFWAWFDGKDLIYCQWGNSGEIDITPVKAKFEGMEVEIPKDYDKTLKYLYGDWRVPRQEKSKLKRASYLYA
jgi:lipopolysaccharide cholinephosphotransferase